MSCGPGTPSARLLPPSSSSSSSSLLVFPPSLKLSCNHVKPVYQDQINYANDKFIYPSQAPPETGACKNKILLLFFELPLNAYTHAYPALIRHAPLTSPFSGRVDSLLPVHTGMRSVYEGSCDVCVQAC